MSFAHGLYQRFRGLIQEAASFGVVGAIGFVVTLGGSDLLHVGAGLGPTTAEVIATVVATAVTYLGNRYWSFRHRTRTNVPREALIFFFLNGVGIVIQTICVDFTYYVLGLHANLIYNVALIAGIGLGTIFRWWSYRKWVWAAPQAGETGAVQAVPAGGFGGAGAPAASPRGETFGEGPFHGGADGNRMFETATYYGNGPYGEASQGNGPYGAPSQGNGSYGTRGNGAHGAAGSNGAVGERVARKGGGGRHRRQTGGQPDLQPVNGHTVPALRPQADVPSLEE